MVIHLEQSLTYFNESRINALKEIIEKSESDKEFYYNFGEIELTIPALL
jgi:hypothetical protein